MSAQDFLTITDRISALPIIHGAGDFAVEVRDRILKLEPDCVAIPLPPSFQDEVEAGVDELPYVSMVSVNEDAPSYFRDDETVFDEPWEQNQQPEDDSGAEDELLADQINLSSYNYVPIDPCQPVISALRVAMGERISRAFIDLEVECFHQDVHTLPDPYALKKVPLEAFAASLLTIAPKPSPSSQRNARIRWMADALLELEERYKRIVFVCSAMDWPWIRSACREGPSKDKKLFESHSGAPLNPPRRYGVSEDTLAFLLGEFPYLTYLYEKKREEFVGDSNLSIDGVKELLLEARTAWLKEHKPAQNWVTPQRLQIFLQYARNLTLRGRRLTPDLFTLTLAAKQTAGDAFALSLLATAREYPYQSEISSSNESDLVHVGVNRAAFPDGDIGTIKSRLGGSAVTWKSISLKPNPTPFEKQEWAQRWNPFGMCSWPPEDEAIESFHTHVREQAKALLGEDLARTEKFTTSIKDGLDIRETLRNWHTGDLYVKEIPPARGNLEVIVFLFDTPADAEKYSWRTMWYAEHDEESTLCMYATPFESNLVGPGVAESQYGGAFFVFPPRYIEDVWRDSHFHYTQTLEERLIAGACFHSKERFIALVSSQPPNIRWRQIARLYKKHLIHIPIGRFSGETIARIRRFHVLNGKDIRSYAARFIREM